MRMLKNIHYFVFVGCLMIAVFYDLRYRIVPNWLIGFMFFFWGISFCGLLLDTSNVLLILETGVISQIIGGIVAFVVTVLMYRLCHGGFGAGDGKLMVMMGL